MTDAALSAAFRNDADVLHWATEARSHRGARRGRPAPQAERPTAARGRVERGVSSVFFSVSPCLCGQIRRRIYEMEY